MNEIIGVALVKKVTVALLSSPETCILFAVLEVFFGLDQFQ